MHIRVPNDIEDAFIPEIRRKRSRLNLIIFPVVVAGVSVFLMAKAHSVYRLFRLLYPASSVSDGVPPWFIAVLLGCVAIATLACMRVLARRPLLHSFLYCSRCEALDFDEVGRCPRCGDKLTEKAQFLFTISDDELEIAKRYGLTESKSA